jgi:hypothetical protein
VLFRSQELHIALNSSSLAPVKLCWPLCHLNTLISTLWLEISQHDTGGAALPPSLQLPGPSFQP